MLSQLSAKQKRVLKWAGYPLLALLTFLFAAAYTFPYDRLKDRIEDELAGKYDVHIESISPTILPGGMVLSSITLKTRPTRDGEKPVSIFIDSVELDFGLLAALRGRLDLDILAEVGAGRVIGHIRYNKAGLFAEFKTEQLPLASLPGVAEAVGLPMSGPLDAVLSLELPQFTGKDARWRDAEGMIEISCQGCTIGDGKSQLNMRPRPGPGGRATPAPAASMMQGVTVPRLSLGRAVATVEISGGIGVIKQFSAVSNDGQLSIDGEIHFKDPFKQSTFPGCMRFKLSDDLKQRERDFGNIEHLLPAQARQPDGTFAIPTQGTLAALRWNVRRRCEGGAGEDEAERARPTITARPEPARVAPAPDPDDGSGEDPEEDERIRRAAGEPEGEPADTIAPSSFRNAARGDDDVRIDPSTRPPAGADINGEELVEEPEEPHLEDNLDDGEDDEG